MTRDDQPAWKDAERGPRLQKVLAAAGVASRRDCEQMILEGRVRVNGETVTTLPVFVDPGEDRVEVDGKRIAFGRGVKGEAKRHAAGGVREAVSGGAGGGGADHFYIMLNKPRGVISTTQDPQGRRTVLDLVELPRGVHRRIYPVGRLDADSTGLLLLTDDGELANRLTHPRYEISKQYHLSIRGRLSDEDMQNLRNGLILARRRPPGAPKGQPARKAAMADVTLVGYQHDKAGQDRTVLDVTLKEGQNREIRRMMARLGFNVRRLQRTAIGPVQLKGLGPGKWRMLTTAERGALFRAAGLR